MRLLQNPWTLIKVLAIMLETVLLEREMPFHFIQGSCRVAHMLIWKVDSLPTIKREDVGISCETTKSCQTRKWVRIGDDGQPSPPLIIDGAPSNTSKYAEVLQHDRFTLIIKTFSEEDIHGTYQCVCDLETGVGNIPLDEFVVLPTEDTISYSFNMTQHTLQLSITFSRVRPTPDCEIVLGDHRLIPQLDKDEVGLHYKVRYTLYEKLPAYQTCATLSVTCKLPNYERLWKGINKTHHFTHCKGNGGGRLASNLCVLFLAILVKITQNVIHG